MYPSKSILFALAATAVAASPMLFSAEAEARPNTRSYSCERLLDIIDDRGAMVINYKGNSIYHRFVSTSAYCDHDQYRQRITVRSADGDCRLHYCKPRLNDYKIYKRSKFKK